MSKAIVGKWYKHYKGTFYKVVSISTHTETGEELVNYSKGPYDKDTTIWSRPRAMFEDVIDDGSTMTIMKISPEKWVHTMTEYHYKDRFQVLE